MNYVLFAALSVFSVVATAGDAHNNAEHNQRTPAAVKYNYSQTLDIAKVISLSSATSDECEPVQAHMIYLDSQGVRHNLEYLRLSESCARS